MAGCQGCSRNPRVQGGINCFGLFDGGDAFEVIAAGDAHQPDDSMAGRHNLGFAAGGGLDDFAEVFFDQSRFADAVLFFSSIDGPAGLFGFGCTGSFCTAFQGKICFSQKSEIRTI